MSIASRVCISGSNATKDCLSASVVGQYHVQMPKLGVHYDIHILEAGILAMTKAGSGDGSAWSSSQGDCQRVVRVEKKAWN